jgi:hypothetical protein
MSTLFPIEWLKIEGTETESDPLHTIACVAVGADASDEEIAVTPVDASAAREAIGLAGKSIAYHDDDAYFAVTGPVGARDGYARLVLYRSIDDTAKAI